MGTGSTYCCPNCGYRKELHYGAGFRSFVSEDVKAYFSSKAWYSGIYSSQVFDAVRAGGLNEYEKANIQFLLEYEKKHRA